MELPPILIPVFGGQGGPSFGPHEKPIGLPKFASAVVLLNACYETLHSELALLTPKELTEVDICTSDFANKESILESVHEKYRDNPVLTGSALALIQSLSYLTYVEDFASEQRSHTYFTTVLQSNIHHQTGILGFSSGIISACVVASSPSITSFIFNAVEAYRLALWIGIRSQIHRVDLLRSLTLRNRHGKSSWSIVLGGLKEHEVLQLIRAFNEPFGVDHIAITAVIGDQRVTVSGIPCHLDDFTKNLSKAVVVYPIDINALYHRADLDTVRNDVLADVASRNIRFPTFTDLITPIRSTFSGELVFQNNGQVINTLVEEVVDMVLIHPVKWDMLIHKSISNLPEKSSVNFLNIGLGPSLMKRVEGAFVEYVGPCCQVINLSGNILASKPIVKQVPVAIIGMAVDMPGARTVSELWKILESGRSTLSTIPEDRFRFDDYTANTLHGRSLKTSTGNFVNGIGEFDHRFFNISAREARSMDPQQRILLQVGYQALEHAGYVPSATATFNPDTFGCFIGAATHDYVHNLKNDIDTYYSTGNLTAFLSGRLSYCLNLSGPSIVVDTACSSSMVAVHQAVRALMNQDCHAALAGGVNVISSPDMFIGLDQGHFLSPTGQCKSFDASADGYSRSEGCGVFVLKRLTDALNENDQILGVIRGIEINQSGTAQSITQPHIPTQEALFRRILCCSDVRPNSVTVVEAHGTGTQAGDISELESIRRVLAADRTPDNPLHVTSIKANIGHLEAASGCASLAKVLLMFQYKIIPRQISLKTLNPKILDLESDHIEIITKNKSWLTSNGRESRIALINNFGAAGSNTALLVEEHILNNSQHLPTTTHYMLGLSAKDEPTLEIIRSNLLGWLQMPDHRHVPLLDAAYTTTARRQIYRYRIALSASSRSELISSLTKSPIFDVKQSSATIFVFSGQGSHCGGIGSLYKTYPLFKRHIDECESILAAAGFPGILSVTVSRGTGSQTATNVSEQLAIFALEYSLAQLWLSWGVKPIAVMGHSLGEYAALVIAGVLPLKDALLTVARRAQAMLAKCPKSATGMVAVSLGAEDVQAILYAERRFAGLSIACFNAPQECVLAGPLSTLDCFVRFIGSEYNVKATQLHVPYGYHSSALSMLKNDLLDMSKSLHTSPTRLPFISTVLGQIIMPGDTNFPPADYLARHCIEPVRFTQAIESFLQSSIYSKSTVYIEIGPHPVVLGLLRSFPALSAVSFVASVRRSQDPSLSLSNALATLYVSKCSVNWRSVFRDMGSPACIDLPSYPFTRRNFWVPFTEALGSTLPGGRKYSFVPDSIPNTIIEAADVFNVSFQDLSHYVKGHRVGEIPLCPASVYLEVIQEAICLSFRSRKPPSGEHFVVLRHLAFPNPLTWHRTGKKCTVELAICLDTPNRAFVIKSQVSGKEAETIYANGSYGFTSVSDTQKHFARFAYSFGQSIEKLEKPETGSAPDTFSTRTIYDVIFPRVVEYAKDFHALRSLIISPDGLEATGVMQLGSSCETGQFVVHPVFLDTLLHIAGFLSNLRGDLNDAYICNEISAVHLLPLYFADKTASFTVYCKISGSTNPNCMVGETFARSTGTSQVLVAHFEGIRFQRVRLSGLKAGLAAISGISPSLVHPPRPEEGSCFAPSKDVVHQIIAMACNMNPNDISDDQNLGQLGIDSLTLLELSCDLLKIFSAVGYTPLDLVRCNTVGDLIEMMLAEDDVKSPDKCPQTPVSSTPSYISSSATLVHYGDVANSPVRKILANILDMKEDCIKDDSDLGSLGLDSFASIEALHSLRHDYNLEAPRDLFTSSRTVQDLEHQIGELELSPLARASPICLSQNPFKKMCEALSVNRSLSLLQNVPSALPPLVLVHDGSGLTISYERLANLNRRVWTISNPRFISPEPWRSVVEMAQTYADLIFNEIEGPMILGGWSYGGVVAFEIARQLKATRSNRIHGVILIDSPSPFNHVPLTSSLVDRVLSGADGVDSESHKLCKAQFLSNAQLLDKYTPLPATRANECCPLVFLRSSKPYMSSEQEDVPPWLSDRTDPEKITAGWRTISCGSLIRTLDIPGHHFEPFNQQNIALVSERIKEACQILDTI